MLLWEFLLQLLEDNKEGPRCVSWIDKKQGVFKLTDNKEVSKLWGLYKNKPDMNYDIMGRAFRYCYKKNALEKVKGRFMYKFKNMAIEAYDTEEENEDILDPPAALRNEELATESAQAEECKMITDAENEPDLSKKPKAPKLYNLGSVSDVDARQRTEESSPHINNAQPIENIEQKTKKLQKRLSKKSRLLNKPSDINGSVPQQEESRAFNEAVPITNNGDSTPEITSQKITVIADVHFDKHGVKQKPKSNLNLPELEQIPVNAGAPQRTEESSPDINNAQPIENIEQKTKKPQKRLTKKSRLLNGPLDINGSVPENSSSEDSLSNVGNKNPPSKNPPEQSSDFSWPELEQIPVNAGTQQPYRKINFSQNITIRRKRPPTESSDQIPKKLKLNDDQIFEQPAHIDANQVDDGEFNSSERGNNLNKKGKVERFDDLLKGQIGAILARSVPQNSLSNVGNKNIPVPAPVDDGEFNLSERGNNISEEGLKLIYNLIGLIKTTNNPAAVQKLKSLIAQFQETLASFNCM